MTSAEARPGSPTLTLRGGGWVIVLTVLAVAGLLVWAFSGVLSGRRPMGDGHTAASYGFSLEPLLVDSTYLAGSGNPRDFLTTLDEPSAMLGSAMLDYNERERNKYVVTTDRVAGVVVNGDARAYPLAVLNAHEVVNDTLGGVPIAVTYSPLTDSVVVFDRRVNGEPRNFKVSGLLYNSNLVLYEVPVDPAAAANHTSSLWSQLGMRAIAGPEAAGGRTLTPLPGVNIASWHQWLTAHPDTSVILPDPATKQRYKEFSYARYFLTPRVEFPVAALPEARPEAMTPQTAVEAEARGDPPTRKTAVVAVTAGGATEVWTLAHVLAQTGNQDGVWTTSVGGVPLRVTTQCKPLAVMVESADGSPVTVIPQLWFAHTAFAAQR